MLENVVKNKSFAFAIRVVKLYQFLCETKKRVCTFQAVAEKWNTSSC